jgi:hypothetical protein
MLGRWLTANRDGRIRRCPSGPAGGALPRGTSWRSWPPMTPLGRARRARSCAGRACIPVTSWSGGGPATPGRSPAWPGPAGGRLPIPGTRRSPGCKRRRHGWSRSWPRPASWWTCRQNCGHRSEVGAMTDDAIAMLAPRTGTRAACAAVGAPQASYYRRHRASPPPPRPVPAPHAGRVQPRALSQAERQEILTVLYGRAHRRLHHPPRTVRPPAPGTTTAAGRLVDKPPHPEGDRNSVKATRRCLIQVDRFR